MATNSVIQERIKSLLTSQNPTIDVSDLIIKDLFVNFGANVVSEVDSRVNNIAQRFSISFLDNLTDTQLDNFAYSMKGLVRSQGAAASTYVYVILSKRPAEDVLIPANTIFATQDNNWQFYSTQAIAVSLGSLDSYYNASKGTYEIRVPVQAVGVGTNYNVAAYRINVIVTSLPFTARVENREKVDNGLDPQTTADFKREIQAALAGFDANSKLGVTQKVMQALPTAGDIQILHSVRDANVFDVYFTGMEPYAASFSYTAVSSKDRRIAFPAEYVPIRYVDSVLVDNVPLDSNSYTYSKYELILDNTVSVVEGTVIIVVYQYNGLVSQLSSYLTGLVDIADSKWTPKEATAISLKVSVKVRPASFIAIEEVQDTIINYLSGIVGDQFIDSLSASAIEEQMKTTYANIAELQIRFNGSQFIQFEAGTYPIILAENIIVDSF